MRKLLRDKRVIAGLVAFYVLLVGLAAGWWVALFTGGLLIAAIGFFWWLSRNRQTARIGGATGVSGIGVLALGLVLGMQASFVPDPVVPVNAFPNDPRGWTFPRRTPTPSIAAATPVVVAWPLPPKPTVVRPVEPDEPDRPTTRPSTRAPQTQPPRTQDPVQPPPTTEAPVQPPTSEAPPAQPTTEAPPVQPTTEAPPVQPTTEAPPQPDPPAAPAVPPAEGPAN